VGNVIKKKGTVWIFAGLLLLLAAISLISYNVWTEFSAGAQANKVVNRLAEIIPEETRSILSDTDLSSTEIEYPYYVLNPDMDMPVKEIDGAKYIGLLSIPKLSLELPIQSEWSYPSMKVSPCRYEGSVYLNNMVICGHNYSTHFGTLKDLEKGDSITFTDMDGNVFRYQVMVTEILQPTAVEEMISGDWDLTLFTCTIGGATRVTVRCNRTEDAL
jgi:sortase A